MPCDHTTMGTTGADRATTCPGCGSRIGKFTLACGCIFTVEAAAQGHVHAQ